jgi:hypothetical protein
MPANASKQQPMSFGQFVWREVTQRVRIGALVLIIALLALPLLRPRPADWWDWIDPLISLLTLGVAFFIWVGQLRRAWEEYLPNRLTVHFYYNGREVMRCEKAYLANESDIRALGQHIGGQMADVNYLRLIPPRVEISQPETNSEERYVHYTVRFHLSELPSKLQNLQPNEVLVWRPPFDEEPQVEQAGGSS